jgi:DNA-directed RNA polymerase subunit omega
MLTKPSIESLLPKVDSRYTLAILVAKRARQIVTGGLLLVPCDSPNTVTQACEELAGDRLTYVRGDVSVFVPLRPEILMARLQAQDPEARMNDIIDDLGEDVPEPAAPVAYRDEARAEEAADAAVVVDVLEAVAEEETV